MTESQSLGGTPAASLHRLLNGAATGLLIVAGFGAAQGRMPGATVFLLAALGAGTLARRAQQGGFAEFPNRTRGQLDAEVEAEFRQRAEPGMGSAWAKLEAAALGVKELAVKDRELMMSNHMAELREEDE